MTDNSDIRPSGTSRLSRAGKEALDEHLSRERIRVLREASRLGRGAPLSAFDIVNAVEALSARETASSRHSYPAGPALLRSRTMAVSAAVMMLAALSLLLVIFVLAVPKTPDANADQILPILLGVLTASFAVVGATVAMLLVTRANTARRRQEARYLYELDATSGRLDRAVRSISANAAPRRDDKRGQFISKWISFEHQLRELGSREIGISSEDARRYPIGELLRMLRAETKISGKQYAQIRATLDLRNRVMHNGDAPAEEVERGIRLLSDLGGELEPLVIGLRRITPDQSD